MVNFKGFLIFLASFCCSIKRFSNHRNLFSLFKILKSINCSELIFQLKFKILKSSSNFPPKIEMKVLEMNRNFLIFLGACPSPNSKWSIIFKINYILVLVLQILGLISSIWFIVKFIRIDLNSVLYAGFHTSAYSSSTYSLLVGYMVQHKIMLTFTKLQKIYDESNCFRIFHLLSSNL